jgi:ribosome-associated toxin RatA of RatAB toxin-antitoxin module
MHEIRRSALVPYSLERMYGLVADFERYPEFVPWVRGTQYLERGPAAVVGRIEMQYSRLRESFTTHALLDPPKQITLTLMEGPFDTFHGVWTFAPIADRGCRIELTVRFRFKSSLLDLLLSRTFEKSCSQLVDAFVARARSMYRS